MGDAILNKLWKRNATQGAEGENEEVAYALHRDTDPLASTLKAATVCTRLEKQLTKDDVGNKGIQTTTPLKSKRLQEPLDTHALCQATEVVIAYTLSFQS